MVKIECFCWVCGETFSPRKAEKLTGWIFSEKDEPRLPSDEGSAQGMSVLAGSAIYDFGRLNDCSDPSFLKWLDRVKSHIPSLKQAGAERILLEFLVAYNGQCNLEAEPDFFAAVASLGLPVTMSCWVDENLPEPELIVVE